MTKKLFFRIMLGALLAFSVVLSGCSTFETQGRLERGVFQDIRSLPAKDFVSLGLVFVDNAVVSNGRGHVFIYNELLRQAHALGADTIINVVIDRKIEGEITRFGSMMLSQNVDETWYGSGTAIRYVPGVLTDSVVMNEVASGGGGGFFAPAGGGGGGGNQPRGFIGNLLSRIPLLGRLF